MRFSRTGARALPSPRHWTAMATACPDDRERKFGRNPHDASDASQNNDGDGYTNVEEFLNDTDPNEFVDYTKPENNSNTLK